MSDEVREPLGSDEVIEHVYAALKAKGHDPVMQLVGYIFSGDPTYITSYNNARSLVRRVERDDLIEEFVRYYVENKIENKNGKHK